MSIKIISALVLLGTIIVFTLFLLLAHLSTWFIWELLPAGDIQIAVNQTNRAANLLTGYLSATQLGATLEKLESARRFSISKSHGTTTVVIVPNNPLLFRNHLALTEQLNSAGFHTERFGLLVIARQSNGVDNIVHPKFFPAFRQTTRRLFSNTLPAKPIFIASMESGTIPFLENPITVLGTATGRNIRLIATEPTMGFNFDSYDIPLPLQQENELAIAIPSHILDAIPEPLHQKWNNLLNSNLGLTNTQPDIISSLAQYNSPVIIKLLPNTAVIAVTNMQKTFSDNIKKWVQTEEAYARLRRKAFRLPDGSLGYELTPGDTREVFMNSASSNDCRQDAYPRLAEASGEGGPIPMHYLWLCVSDSIAAFGSNENATAEAIQQPAPPVGRWSAYIGTQYLADISLSGIKSISATGTDTQAVIHLQLSDTLQ